MVHTYTPTQSPCFGGPGGETVLLNFNISPPKHELFSEKAAPTKKYEKRDLKENRKKVKTQILLSRFLKFSEVSKKWCLRYSTLLNQLFSYNSGVLFHFLYFDLSNAKPTLWWLVPDTNCPNASGIPKSKTAVTERSRLTC